MTKNFTWRYVCACHPEYMRAWPYCPAKSFSAVLCWLSTGTVLAPIFSLFLCHNCFRNKSGIKGKQHTTYIDGIRSPYTWDQSELFLFLCLPCPSHFAPRFPPIRLLVVQCSQRVWRCARVRVRDNELLCQRSCQETRLRKEGGKG